MKRLSAGSARLAWWTIVVAAAAAASWLRHQWVEGQGLGALCVQSPEQWPCAPRQVVIDVFLNHKLGGVAIGLGVVALCWAWWGRQPDSAAHSGAVWMISVCAATAAAAGLVLYDADLSALGLIISAMACARATQPPDASAR